MRVLIARLRHDYFSGIVFGSYAKHICYLRWRLQVGAAELKKAHKLISALMDGRA